MANRSGGGRIAAVIAVMLFAVAACAAPTATQRPTGAAPTGAAPTSQATSQTTAPASEAATTEPTAEGSPAATEEPVASETPGPTFVIPPGTGDIRWFCCLGTGEDPEAQIPLEQQVAADYSAANPDTTMTFEVITYLAATDQLSTMIGGQNAPDIVGPVGVGGIEGFHGQWLDMAPLIESSAFDLSAYPEAAVEFYQTEDGQIGIPFATYPSVLWYSRALFDEAELAYPPHEYGAPYVMPDGTEREWNYDTVRELALILTVDANGNDATSADFDPENIVQWGFEPQRDDLRGLGAYHGAGSLVGPDGRAHVPDAWRDAWRYFYDGIWTDHFIMTGPIFDDVAPDAGGFAFFTGNVAMSANFLWTTYGVGEDTPLEGIWDMAALPSHNGVTTSPLNADTFVIHESTDQPDAAFDAVTYMQVDRGPELLDIYGGLPARPDQQDAWFQAQEENFTHGVDWQVVIDSLNHPDSPNFEAFMPAYNETVDLLREYNSKWTSTPGLDLDAEITQLEAEVQAIWDAAAQ